MVRTHNIQCFPEKRARTISAKKLPTSDEQLMGEKEHSSIIQCPDLQTKMAKMEWASKVKSILAS